jgi:predicted nuclease with RNAse H fold
LATLRCGQHVLPLTFTNHFLAHLQVAVHRRFERGGGFFLTGTYPDSDGNEVTVSHWLHPSTALVFTYDVRDDNDDRIAPVGLDHKEIDAILEAMDRPVGVRTTGEVWLTFRDKL